jgi:hypothetical protein
MGYQLMALSDSLQHKIGPLPTWGWLGIATAGFGVFYLVEKKKAASATTTPTNTSSATTNTSGTTNPGGQGQVPQYVGIEQQTSSNVNSNNTAPVSVNSPVTTNSGPGSGATTTGGTTNNVGPITAPLPSVPPIVTTPARPTSITAPGTDSGDINRIAIQYGLTEAELIAANPFLKTMKVTVNGKTVKLVGSGQPVPGGTKLTIPPVPAKK